MTTETDFAGTIDSDDTFSAEEQAAWDAMRNGEAAPEPQAAAEPAPAAEPVAEAAAPGEVVDPDAPDADDAEKNRGRFVRHGAFHKEREARKAERARAEAAEAKYAELHERFTRGDERMRILQEAARAQPAAAAQPAAEPAKAPNPEEDIFGYAKHLEQQIADLKNGVEKTTQEARQEREFKAVRDDYIADLNRFGAKEPTFADAFRFVAQTRAQELLLLGHPEAQIPQLLGQEELQISLQARQRGQSPAEMLFAIAKARGFTPKAPEPAPAATSAPEAAPAETAAEKQARLAAAQKGPGMSLSAAGGAPGGEITAEMLADLPEEEFAKLLKNNGRKVRALMGG